jgi:hypothetical protein
LEKSRFLYEKFGQENKISMLKNLVGKSVLHDKKPD